MSEIPDGRLLWMIHFDRHNYTKEWIQKAEVEAQRRDLSLHKIDESYKNNFPQKQISQTFDAHVNDPHPFFKRWWREMLVGFSLVTCEIILAPYLHWLLVSIFEGIVGVILIEKICGQNVPQQHKKLAWAVVIILILVGYFFPS